MNHAGKGCGDVFTWTNSQGGVVWHGSVFRFSSSSKSCKICNEKRLNLYISNASNSDFTPQPFQCREGEDYRLNFSSCIYCQLSNATVQPAPEGVCTNCINQGFYIWSGKKFSFVDCSYCEMEKDEARRKQLTEEAIAFFKNQETLAYEKFYWNSQVRAMKTLLLCWYAAKNERGNVLGIFPRDIIILITKLVGKR